MGRGDLSAHGFRSTFRDWAGNETAHPREVAEAALAHLVGDEAERAYRRSDASAKRRHLMDDWASFVCEEGHEVVVTDHDVNANSPARSGRRLSRVARR